MFTGPDGRMLSMPLNWTSTPEDPFVMMARGRSLFRLSDLAALLHLVNAPEGKGPRQCVKQMSPRM